MKTAALRICLIGYYYSLVAFQRKYGWFIRIENRIGCRLENLNSNKVLDLEFSWEISLLLDLVQLCNNLPHSLYSTPAISTSTFLPLFTIHRVDLMMLLLTSTAAARNVKWKKSELVFGNFVFNYELQFIFFTFCRHCKTWFPFSNRKKTSSCRAQKKGTTKREKKSRECWRVKLIFLCFSFSSSRIVTIMNSRKKNYRRLCKEIKSNFLFFLSFITFCTHFTRSWIEYEQEIELSDEEICARLNQSKKFISFMSFTDLFEFDSSHFFVSTSAGSENVQNKLINHFYTFLCEISSPSISERSIDSQAIISVICPCPFNCIPCKRV